MTTRPPVAVPFEVEQSGVVRLRVTAADGTVYVLRLSLAIASVIDSQQLNSEGMPVFNIQSVCAMHVIRADATATEVQAAAASCGETSAALLDAAEGKPRQTERDLN